jgi:alpha-tubulin suppressor-like RCC1 family protein
MTTKMYAWGRDPNDAPSLGFPATWNTSTSTWNTTSYSTPTKVDDDTDWNKIILSKGRDNDPPFASFAIKNNGRLYGSFTGAYFGYSSLTGNNFSGWRVIGTDTWIDICTTASTRTGYPGGAYGIKSNGTLWRAGGSDISTPFGPIVTDWTQVGTDTNWSKISAGAFHIAALKSNGDLYLAGLNGAGQLGFGDVVSNSTSYSTLTYLASGFSDVACGTYSTFALKTADGAIWSAGLNSQGTVGSNAGIHTYVVNSAGNVQTFDAATKVNSSTDTITITNHGFKTYDTARYLTNGNTSIGPTNGVICVVHKITDDTFKLASTSNPNTYLNITATSGTHSLTQVCHSTLSLADSTKFSKISTCYNSGVIAISTAGELWNWGFPNALGTNSSNNWKKLGSDTDWGEVAITASTATSGTIYGQATIIAKKSNGSLWGYGYNSYGEAGLNSTTPITSLTQISPGGISKISKESNNNFAVTVSQPVSSFTLSKTSNTTVQFTNTSSDSSSYLIDWGDGTTTSIANNSTTGAPGVGTLTHTYTVSSDTRYTITLTAQVLFIGGAITNSSSTTVDMYAVQSPSFTVVEQGVGPSVVVRNTSPNTLGSTAIFGSGNKWRWDWGDGTYTDVNSGSGSSGDRLVNLEHFFTFTGPEIIAGAPVTRTVTLKAYNGHSSSPFSTTSTTVTVIPLNPSFPNTVITIIEEGDIPAIFNAPKNITWASST